MIPEIIFILFFTLILVGLLVPVGRYRRSDMRAHRSRLPSTDEELEADAEPEAEAIGIGMTMLFFFFILFPLILAGSHWVGPHGPMFMGISWMPIVVLGILLALLIAALSPREPKMDARSTPAPEEPVTTGVAAFFGLMYFLLLFAAIALIIAAII